LLRQAYFSYLRLVVPVFGLVFCGDPAAYRYKHDSLREYPAQEGVSEMLRANRCEVEVVDFLGGAMSLHVARKAPASLGQGDDVALETGGLIRQ
jgi:ubiquinone/menaquinone biosynthesis C-methylase UbiE